MSAAVSYPPSRAVPEPLATAVFVLNEVVSRVPTLLFLRMRWVAVIDRVVTNRTITVSRNALIAMTCLDSYFTWLWLDGGHAIEANPVVDGIIAQFGLGAGLGARAVYVSALIAGLAFAARRMPLARSGIVILYPFLTGITLYHLYGAWMIWRGIW